MAAGGQRRSRTRSVFLPCACLLWACHPCTRWARWRAHRNTGTAGHMIVCRGVLCCIVCLVPSSALSTAGSCACPCPTRVTETWSGMACLVPTRTALCMACLRTLPPRPAIPQRRCVTSVGFVETLVLAHAGHQHERRRAPATSQRLCHLCLLRLASCVVQHQRHAAVAADEARRQRRRASPTGRQLRGCSLLVRPGSKWKVEATRASHTTRTSPPRPPSVRQHQQSLCARCAETLRPTARGFSCVSPALPQSACASPHPPPWHDWVRPAN